MAGLCTHVSSFLYVFVCVLVSIFVDMFRVYILYILKYDCTCVLSKLFSIEVHLCIVIFYTEVYEVTYSVPCSLPLSEEIKRSSKHSFCCRYDWCRKKILAMSMP